MRVFRLTWQFRQHFRDVELTPKERDRLHALHLLEQTHNVTLVCSTFGISRASLYRWKKRFDRFDPNSLKDRSRRPRHLRQPTWSTSQLVAVKRLREQYPRWGREKLKVLLARESIHLSAKTIDRMIASLRTKGRLVEPRPRAISAKRRKRPRIWAVRKPAGYIARLPGDLVQIDTLDIRPLPGVCLKQFTARDVISRWDVIEAHQRATAASAVAFLDTLQQRMPFPIRALQVDGGSEFYAAFEQECQRRDLRLFALPPKSPKLNGAVERANRTHTEEFYETTDCNWTVAALNRELAQWEHVYNTIRPHQALHYLTPLQFLQHQGIIPLPRSSLSHMY